MNRDIRLLVEEYINSTEQMNNSIKSYNKSFNRLNRQYDERFTFICDILGKKTYNKYMNKGVFAPVPLSAINLSFKDFYMLNPNVIKNQHNESEENELFKLTGDNTHKLIKLLSNEYSGKELKLINDGYNLVLHTNIVFRTMDEVIDFLLKIKNIYKKLYKSDDINWKFIQTKFRKYLS